MYMCLNPGGSAICIIAKSDNQAKKLRKKSSIIDEFEDFYCLGKLTQVAVLWKTKLKNIKEKSGQIYLTTEQYKFNLLKKGV